MKIFIDTNIWVYQTNANSIFHAAATQKLIDLQANGFIFHISTQVLREYAKATTLEAFLTHSQVQANMSRMRLITVVLEETQPVTVELEKLIGRFNVKGKSVYDCNIVATMQHYSVDTILTHNVKDFTPRYDGLLTVLPLL